MATATWRRSLAELAAPPRPGDDTFPSIEPGPATHCLTINRRPRDLAQFQAAYAAAGGADVVEIEAVAAQPGMHVWHLSSFRAITNVGRNGDSVSLWMLGDGAVPSRCLDNGLPLYVRQTPPCGTP